MPVSATAKAAGWGRMCPTGASARRRTPGAQRARGQTGGDEVIDAHHRTEGRPVGTRRGWDGEHEVRTPPHRGDDTGRMAGHEGAEQVGHDPGEVAPCLVDPRLLVPPQHGVERPVTFAEPERQQGGQRGSQAAGHEIAGEADGPGRSRRPATDPAHPRARSRDGEGGVRRIGGRVWVRLDVRERSRSGPAGMPGTPGRMAETWADEARVRPADGH